MKLVYLPWNSPAAGTNQPCLGDQKRVLSYAQVESRAAAFAEQLAELGLGRGDVLAIKLPNSLDLLIGMLAAWRLGAAVTTINPTFTERELSYQLGDSGATTLLSNQETSAGLKLIRSDEMREHTIHQNPAPEVYADDLALVIYTSGSTGQPKGVMLTHANLLAMTGQMVQVLTLSASDHALLVLPLFHVNSITVSFLTPMTVGARVTVLERFTPDTFVQAIERFQPTYFSAVPAIYARLAELPEDVVPDVESLRFGVCGAAPMTHELIDRIENRFGISLVEGYGLTEATCASATNPVVGLRKPGTVGPAIPGQQIKIVGADGSSVEPGERGEVLISGPTVMRGYLGRPEATAEAIQNGWLRTGDVGILDEDGYLSIVDRIKDMIIRGGENIYPKEIEAYLAEHPDVLESAVVGAPHETLGEVPVAQVVVVPGARVSEADLIHHCQQGLTKIKVPVRLEIVPDLPRNPVGKVDKPRMRREAFSE